MTVADDRVYEVFIQASAGKPIQHVGSVRAGDGVFAWHAAWEIYARREECSLLWVVPRSAITTGADVPDVVLGRGSSRRYRLPTYPSAKRRARLKAARAAATPSAEVS